MNIRNPLIILLAGVLILVASVSYYLWYRDSGDKQTNNTQSEQTVPISIDQPKANSTIETPFVISGRAYVFEGPLNYRITEDDGKVLQEGTISIPGVNAGKFSNYSVVIENLGVPSSKRGNIEVYNLSAKTGSEDNLAYVPIRFGNIDEGVQLSFQSITYNSPNGNFVFQYPKFWHLTESITNPFVNAGVFGDVQSAWNVSSFDPENSPDTGGIPDGSIKIDFEISIPKQGLEIETIAQCKDENNDCENVIINGNEYTRVYSEDGQVPSILYISMNDEMMYRASSLFNAQPGTENFENNVELIDEIASTFIQK